MASTHTDPDHKLDPLGPQIIRPIPLRGGARALNRGAPTPPNTPAVTPPPRPETPGLTPPPIPPVHLQAAAPSAAVSCPKITPATNLQNPGRGG